MSGGGFVFIGLVFWLVPVVAIAAMATSRGQSAAFFAIIAAVCWPIALVWLLVSPDLTRRENADLLSRARAANGGLLPSEAAARVPADRYEALERLDRLRQSGGLTEAEFASEKARVLANA